MQPKQLKKKTVKTLALKERLKPISLEEPLEGSPFLAMVQDDEENLAKAAPNMQARKDLNEKLDDKLASLVIGAKLKEQSGEEQGTDWNAAKPEQNNVLKKNFNQLTELSENRNASDYGVGKVPKRTQNNLTTRKLCKLLEVDNIDEIFGVSDVLRASSLKLYSTLVDLADKNGKLKIKAHELMRESGIKGIATFYKQERWLMDLGLIEKRTKPGPHEGSSYRVYSLDSLPLDQEIFAEFEKHLVQNTDYQNS